MLTGNDPHLTSLSAADSASPEHELAVRYAPFLRFDQREPFLPLTAGYTVIRSSGPSPSSTWFQSGEKMNRWLCCKGAGIGGVLVSELFTGLIDTKSPETDKLVQNFLRRHAFVPSYEFIRKLQIPAERLVPWPELFRWIPESVSYRVKGLQGLTRPDSAPFEPLECEKVP